MSQRIGKGSADKKYRDIIVIFVVLCKQDHDLLLTLSLAFGIQPLRAAGLVEESDVNVIMKRLTSIGSRIKWILTSVFHSP